LRGPPGDGGVLAGGRAFPGGRKLGSRTAVIPRESGVRAGGVRARGGLTLLPEGEGGKARYKGVPLVFHQSLEKRMSSGRLRAG
jgi:hypothetical protein